MGEITTTALGDIKICYLLNYGRANIVAIGLLEKRGHAYIPFFEWLKIGLVVGLLTALISWGMLSVMPMPKPHSLLSETGVAVKTQPGSPSAPLPAR